MIQTPSNLLVSDFAIRPPLGLMQLAFSYFIDLSKKVQELGGAGNAKLVSSSPTPGAADRSKELAKISEMYSAEKKAREDAEERILELQLKLDAAMKDNAASQRRLADSEEQLRLAEEQSQEKLTALEVDIKKRIRESADWKLQAEKHERLKTHSETEYQNVSKKLEDALKKLAKYEQAEKIETIVAQRLESKVVQDLKKQLEAEVAARKFDSKEKDALELSKNSLDKQVTELKKKVVDLEEANAILKIKLDSHQ
jgi:Rho-associated protein kinase 1